MKKKQARVSVLDALIVVVVLYAFAVAVYNTFVSDCTIAGSDSFARKLVTWLIAWPIMLLCKGKGASPVGASSSTYSSSPSSTSFSYSTEI
jgi:hypothetical protein